MGATLHAVCTWHYRAEGAQEPKSSLLQIHTMRGFQDIGAKYYVKGQLFLVQFLKTTLILMKIDPYCSV